MKKLFAFAASALMVLTVICGAPLRAEPTGDPGFTAGRSITYYASTEDNELFGSVWDYQDGVPYGWYDKDKGEPKEFNETPTNSIKTIDVGDSVTQPYCQFTYVKKDGYHALTKTYNAAVADEQIVAETPSEDNLTMPYNGKGSGIADIILGKALRFYAYNTQPDGSGTWIRSGQTLPADVDALYAFFVNPMSLLSDMEEYTKEASTHIELNGSNAYTQENPKVIWVNDGQLQEDALYYTAYLDMGEMASLLAWARTDELNLDETYVKMTINFDERLDFFAQSDTFSFQYTGGFVPRIDGELLNPDENTNNVYTITVTKADMPDNVLELTFGLTDSVRENPTLTLEEFSKMSLTVSDAQGAKAVIPDSLASVAADTAAGADDPSYIKADGTMHIQVTTEGKYPQSKSFDLTIDPMYAQLRKQLDGVSITPADITIYMGGEQGYAGTVDDSGTIIGSSSLPQPGFLVTLPQALSDVPVEDLTFEESGSDRTWTLETYDQQADTTVYRLVGEDGQEPMKVQFTDENGQSVTSDHFEAGDAVHETYAISLYREEKTRMAGDLLLRWEDKTYLVDTSEQATLTVRATSDDVQYGIELQNGSPQSGKPAFAAKENSVYTINDSSVQVSDPSNVALLFDEVLDSAKENRSEMLWERAQEAVPSLSPQSSYELKYLDLVDRNNGNTWVKSSDSVSVYWPLPQGCDETTTFRVLHFKGLHREMQIDNVADEIAAAQIEVIPSRVDGGHVVFEVSSAGFSPFALVWENTTASEPDEQTGALCVTNIVNGPDAAFTYTVTLSEPLSGRYGDMTFTKGTAVFTLKNQESKCAVSLPQGVRYTVSQEEKSGYTTSAQGASGTLAANQTSKAVFTNVKKSTEAEGEKPSSTTPDGNDEGAGGAQQGGNTAAALPLTASFLCMLLLSAAIVGVLAVKRSRQK